MKMEVYTTHSILYGIKTRGEEKEHSLVFYDKENRKEKIKINEIVIKTSPVSCVVIDDKERKHIIPYSRIREIYRGDELVWDAGEINLDNFKIIKGYDK